MPGLIQTPPFGFLSALGLKSSGANPRASMDDLNNTYETNDFYDTSLIATASLGAQTIGAVGAVNFIEVPAGKAWRIIGTQWGAVSAAGGNELRMSVGIRWRGNAIRVWSMTAERTFTAASNMSLGLMLAHPWILQSGARLVWTADHFTGTAVDSSVGAIFVEYDQ